MGAARILPDVVAGDSPLADDSSRQREIDAMRSTLDALRNPAGAIRLAVQLLAGPLRSALRELPPDDAARVRDVLEALETATAELARLLAPLGASNRGRAGEVLMMPGTPIGVDGLIAAVRRSVEQRVRLPAIVEANVDASSAPATNAQDLQTALVGLVENGIEAMARRNPEGSPWVVELRVTVEPAEDLGEGLHVVFDVRDRGDGVPMDVQRWLDDPTGMESTPPAPAGPGMSLQLARRVAEGSGGRLEARRIGGTTRVRLRVPHVPE